ncbi:MAG: glycoside hydrolase family 13 protein [Clostridia bacterium]|nr:glycoside hydrolase family 13 protein [Clostridia bacterium]
MNISALSQKIIHDAAGEEYHRPIGAATTGETVVLSVRDLSGSIVSARLFLWSDDGEQTFDMSPHEGLFSAGFSAPNEPAAMWYCFFLTFQEGGTLWLCADSSGRFGKLMSSRGEGLRLTVYAADFGTPAWFRKSIMYQIFPDRFARDGSDSARRGIEYHRALGRKVGYHEDWSEPVDWLPNSDEDSYFPLDFYGGTLRGVEDRLSYLESLGVGAIYLNPICEARSNHRYDTADYLKTDPILGTDADFIRLCEKAREHKIRVILDGVFSHTGADSVYFNKFGRYPSPGAYNGGENSEYYRWYDFRTYPDDYRCWWNFKNLPEVDESNPGWQDYIINGENSVVKTWLGRGASGFRLDVADELPDDVLALIRRSSKDLSPDNVVIGEVWEDAVIKTSYGKRRKYALGPALDSVMNYPLRKALLSFFTFGEDAFSLSAFLLSQRLNYPPPMYWSLFNLVSSHDTERIRTALASRLAAGTLSRKQQAGFILTEEQDARGAAMQKLCAALQYSIPGVPCVYYGDENGMQGMLDPFNRAPFTAGKRPLTDFYAALGRIRNENDALSVGAAAFFAPNADVLCLLRFISGSKDVFGLAAENGAFLIAVNRAGEERRVVADLWLKNTGLSSSEQYDLLNAGLTHGTCLLDGTEISVGQGLADMTLPPETAHIFRLE